MTVTLLVHVKNENPVVGEADDIPSKEDNLLIIKNPRLRDGKNVPYVAENVVTIMWPLDRINFIEILSGDEDEEIIGFVRE